MDRRSSMVVGGALVLVGILSLMLSGVLSLFGFDLFGFVVRLWPAFIVGVGLLFVVPPFLVRGKRGLGALFIPGLPILGTGAILFLASVFDAWSIWAWLWPMELISLAMGFLLAAAYMRVLGLIIPAVIIGVNGFVFQFCAISGLWHWWSVLWTVEPLAVGLALLLFGARKGSSGTVTAGLILCGVAAACFLLMVTILAGGWLIMLMGPGLLILLGLAVIGWGVLRPMFLSKSAVE